MGHAFSYWNGHIDASTGYLLAVKTHTSAWVISLDYRESKVATDNCIKLQSCMVGMAELRVGVNIGCSSKTFCMARRRCQLQTQGRYKWAVRKSSRCVLYNKWCFQMTDMLYSESRPYANLLTLQYVSSACVYCSFQQRFRFIMNHIQKLLRGKIHPLD
jgi:hypothetical protein